MSNHITYHYPNPSSLVSKKSGDEFLLAQYNEVIPNTAPCFFWGRLTDPFITARCLITLSHIVQSSFNLSPFQWAQLKDPIVTAGNDKIRFEGFSHCAGVYARVDVLPDGHDGEFLENGTTNVDFNTPMIGALGRVGKQSQVTLSVGQKEVSLSHGGQKVVERKVPLPTKWIKGLSTVQLYLAYSEPLLKLSKIQALQLFRAIPKGKTKNDYFLFMRGNRPILSPTRQQQAICIGGIHRLRLLEPLIPHIDHATVYAHTDNQATTWQLYFGPVRFTFSLSRDAWRGFSGEGAGLEALIADVPEALVQRFDNFSYANQEFNPTLLAVEQGIDFTTMENLSARLSAMGMLGYDVDENHFFYRRLPFKLNRIMGLNPRMKNAEKLLAEGKVEIVDRKPERIEAKVLGSGIYHTVVLEAERHRCTCTWYAKNQGERGLCKHVLAVKKLIG
jgi:hypothetical protein